MKQINKNETTNLVIINNTLTSHASSNSLFALSITPAGLHGFAGSLCNENVYIITWRLDY
jgi:hypothetical protein